MRILNTPVWMEFWRRDVRQPKLELSQLQLSTHAGCQKKRYWGFF